MIVVCHPGRRIQVLEATTGALVVEIDGVRLRPHTFIFVNRAIEHAKTHIDQEETK
jgi:hypothetical protein